jgi:hypothetical protein
MAPSDVSTDYSKNLIDNVTLQPPAHGASRRDAINSLVDDISTNLCAEIAALRRELDLIEQRALTDAVAQQHRLTEHVNTAATLHDAVARVREVVTGLSERSRREHP